MSNYIWLFVYKYEYNTEYGELSDLPGKRTRPGEGKQEAPWPVSTASTGESSKLLQADSSITNQDLASRIGLAPATTLERVKKLEAAGVIPSVCGSG
jgi:hypothetical protein